MQLQNANLVVNGLGNTGLDGVIVNTNGYASFVLNYEAIDFATGPNLSTQYIGTDGLGRVKTLGETRLAPTLKVSQPSSSILSFFHKALNSKLGIMGLWLWIRLITSHHFRRTQTGL